MSHIESGFYDVELFPWVNMLESNASIICEELSSFVKKDHQEELWRENYPHYVQSKSTDSSWKTLTLQFFGIKLNEVRNHFPVTCDVLNQVEGLVTAQFSFLQKQTKILPHKGYTQMFARAHLPLHVPFPDLCGIRVGDEIRNWKEGEVLIFNDGIEHEAWNNSNTSRILLLLDVPNPKMNYSASEICRYKLSHLDSELSKIAEESKWQKWFDQGFFD